MANNKIINKIGSLNFITLNKFRSKSFYRKKLFIICILSDEQSTFTPYTDRIFIIFFSVYIIIGA